MTLKDLEAQLRALTPKEKAYALEILARDLVTRWTGIEKTPGVREGAACIRRTRIPVWLLENLRRLGLSDEKILEGYPTLDRSDLENAWAYVSAHPDEIEEEIRLNDQDEDE